MCKKIARFDALALLFLSLHALLSALVTVLYPFILKIAIAGLEEGIAFSLLARNLSVIVVVVLIAMIGRDVASNELWNYRLDRLGTLFSRDLALSALEADYEKMEKPEAQDAQEKARRGTMYGGMVSLVWDGFRLISSCLAFLASCTIVMTVNGWLVLLIVILAIGKLLLENIKQKKEKSEFHDALPPLWRKLAYADGAAKNLDFAKDMRIYGMNDFINQERDETVATYTTLDRKNHVRSFWFETAISLIGLLDELALYGFMIHAVLTQGMTIATFTFMIASVRNLINSLKTAITLHGNLLEESLRVNDLRDFASRDLGSPKATEELVAEDLTITFSHVSYSYDGGMTYALDDVSFTIAPGEKIALVGYNGAGKTTLIKLLCGFYHPTKGTIRLNGVDIETITRDALARLIAPAFQDTVTYALTVEETIAMADEASIDHEKVASLLRLVGLDEKVACLPLKEKTPLTREYDEGGLELSGGENQKASLARAVYKPSALLILDEPTSALDAFAEQTLYENYGTLVGKKSAIFISHRLASTRFCDRIFFMERGRLTGLGTHEELMARDTGYRKLFLMQAENYRSAHDA